MRIAWLGRTVHLKLSLFFFFIYFYPKTYQFSILLFPGNLTFQSNACYRSFGGLFGLCAGLRGRARIDWFQLGGLDQDTRNRPRQILRPLVWALQAIVSGEEATILVSWLICMISGPLNSTRQPSSWRLTILQSPWSRWVKDLKKIPRRYHSGAKW